jgi:hypothetical protein
VAAVGLDTDADVQARDDVPGNIDLRAPGTVQFDCPSRIRKSEQISGGVPHHISRDAPFATWGEKHTG